MYRAYTSDKKYGLKIAHSVLENLEALATVGHVSGGILIGYYTEDLRTAVVTEVVSAPIALDIGGAWFMRGTDGLKDLLYRRWEEDSPTYYLGEWHTCPMGPLEPSAVDQDQMACIASDGRYYCSAPLLILVGQGDIRAWVYPQNEEGQIFDQEVCECKVINLPKTKRG